MCILYFIHVAVSVLLKFTCKTHRRRRRILTRLVLPVFLSPCRSLCQISSHLACNPAICQEVSTDWLISHVALWESVSFTHSNAQYHLFCLSSLRSPSWQRVESTWWGSPLRTCTVSATLWSLRRWEPRTSSVCHHFCFHYFISHTV